MSLHARRLHAHLIGRSGSRRELNTPALIVELAALERNIGAMATLARRAGLALRPHAKTHKCAEIARRQIAAGSLGVCCAKLGEAEALAGAGVSPILITSPVIGPAGAARLAALAARSEGLIAAVDHPQDVEALAPAGARLNLVVDVDPGLHRTGVADPASALALAQKIEATPGLSWAGLQFYCGKEQHIGSFAERRKAIADRTGYLKGVIETFADAGLR
ncbi:MAG: alanine racemase, partial [Caulobacteraceae bacterium]